MIVQPVPIGRLFPKGAQVLLVGGIEHDFLADCVLCEEPRELVLVPLLGVAVVRAQHFVAVGLELAVVFGYYFADRVAAGGGSDGCH